jgi:hypothetical protein
MTHAVQMTIIQAIKGESAGDILCQRHSFTLEMNVNKLIVAAGLILIASAAHAADVKAIYNGNDLLNNCTGDVPGLAWCYGYIEGVVDTIVLGEFSACMPLGVTGQQLREVVVKALRADPVNRNVAAAVLVRNAVALAWGCR